MTTNSSRKPLALIILDGYGRNPNPKANAVAAANKPVMDRLWNTYPHTELTTFGERVGLPDDQMGNSEVGHLNIGAGRVVEQELTRVNRAVREGTLAQHPELKRVFAGLQAEPTKALHIIGLVSHGGVHSSLEHIKAMAAAAAKSGVAHTYIHAITDGRDRPPTASTEELIELEKFVAEVNENAGKQVCWIPTVVGRYFPMDRDKRWERVNLGYALFTEGVGEKFSNLSEALTKRHAAGETDEFLKPIVHTGYSADREPWITDGDTLLFANFRADRMRQIVRTFLGAKIGFAEFNRNKVVTPKEILTLTEYEEGLPVTVLYKPFLIEQHWGNVVADAGLTQLRIAETEKYPHVTYFFSGGKEEILPGEERVIVPSPKDVPTYDLKPDMSARGVADGCIERLKAGKTDVIILNFANCDMVGHTGSLPAAIKAVETVDKCLGDILDVLLAAGGTALVTADHGNSDQMVDYDTGEPHTFHTKHPVPFILVSDALKNVKLSADGALCDIAPTALDILGLKQPAAMTGKSLLIR